MRRKLITTANNYIDVETKKGNSTENYQMSINYAYNSL